MIAIHFVGFRDERYWSAVKIWGKPDFIHPLWDRRAMQDADDTDWINWENHRFEISPEMLEQWSKVFKERPRPMVDGDLWLPSETKEDAPA